MFVKSIMTGRGFKPIPSESFGPTNGGLMYWNNSNRSVKVVDPSGTVQGGSHDVYPQNVMLELDDKVQEILDWSAKKMHEEYELDKLCAEHPSLADIRQHFELMKALYKHAEST